MTALRSKKGKAMNWNLRIGIWRCYGSQTLAAKPLGVEEARLSRLINGHVAPTAKERRRFAEVLGVDYFAQSPDVDDPRVEAG
jgi:hypothetical protein